MKIEPANIASLTMKIEIEASAADVWTALTENIGNWWPADFYAGGVDGQRSYHLDPRPGGHMFESWEGGGGVLWGTIAAADPEKLLQVTGSVFPAFGGPTEWFGTWELEAQSAAKTVLTFSESSVGRVSEKGTGEKDAGWTFLWNTMKAHLEGNAAPAWGE